MTTLAVCSAYYVNTDSVNAGKFKVNVVIAGIVSGNLVDESVQLDNVDPTLSSVLLEQAIKQKVKDELTNNHGYTFGLFDTVRLLNALL
jgi:hypothetical protein